MAAAVSSLQPVDRQQQLYQIVDELSRELGQRGPIYVCLQSGDADEKKYTTLQRIFDDCVVRLTEGNGLVTELYGSRSKPQRLWQNLQESCKAFQEGLGPQGRLLDRLSDLARKVSASILAMNLYLQIKSVQSNPEEFLERWSAVQVPCLSRGIEAEDNAWAAAAAAAREADAAAGPSGEGAGLTRFPALPPLGSYDGGHQFFVLEPSKEGCRCVQAGSPLQGDLEIADALAVAMAEYLKFKWPWGLA
jgi:hypothetical protein